MLIGIDASRANREHKSGTEWYSYYIIKWLAKIDKENNYILYTDSPLRGGLLNLVKDFDITQHDINEKEVYDKDGYQIVKSPYNNFKAKILKWPGKYFWTQGRLSLEMLVNKPDILFIPSHALPIIHPKRSIVTIHDIGFKNLRQLYDIKTIGSDNIKLQRIINFFIYLFSFGKYQATSLDYLFWSTKFALKHAHKILTVSHFTKEELILNFHADEEKIFIVHNGYNETIYKKIDNKEKIRQILSKYGIYQDYIFYVGRIERKKNTPALIEAYAIMRDNNPDIKHKLVLIGDANYGYDEVKYMIEEFDLEDEIIFTGWVEENDMPYLYAGATAFIFPSFYEGFGIPLLQAMACNTPIAASNIASIPEVVDGAALLFNPESVKAMADAMKLIIVDENLRHNLQQVSQIQIKKFGWEISTRKILKELISLNIT
jgi:glycosyltransferase involved in cell wall biosynthesis